MANKKVKIEISAVDKTKAVFDKLTNSLKGIGSASAGAAKGVAGIGLAAGATATALAVLVDKSFQAVDAIGKTSTQTGIATDTLQAFHLAARESGTTIEGANTALIKFARSVGDADKGLKTQADIFKDLGIELRDNTGAMRSFDDILGDTAKGISELGSQSERASALANLFGRQGVILTGAITDLSEKGMTKFIQRAKDLGVVLGTGVIKRTEEFNDAVGVVKMQLGSFVNNITTSLLPVFEDMQVFISERIQKIIDDAGGMEKLGQHIAIGILQGVRTAGVAIKAAFDDLELLFLNFASSSAGKFAGIELTELQLLEVELRNTENQISAIQKKLAGDEIISVFPLVIKDVNGLNIELEKARKIQSDLVAEIGELAPATTPVLDKIDEYIALLEKAKAGADVAFGSGIQEDIEKVTKKMTDIGSPMEVYKKQLNEVGKTMEQIGVKSMKSFEDAIVNGLKTGKLAFKDFATVVVEELIRVAIQQLVIKNLLNMFSFGTVSGSGSGTSGVGGSVMSRDGGGFTGFGSRSGGVDGKGGFPAILHPNETVIDHTKGQGMGATVNFNISTVDAAGFDQLLASRKGLITQIINNAMNTQGKVGVA